jgi:Flp pilus assembly protein TadG
MTMRYPTLRRLRADRRGAVAMEMALMAPVLCSMLFTGIDIANGFAMKLALEQAAQRTAELATAPGTVAKSYANLQPEVIAAYGKPYVSATADNWLECGGTRQGSFTGVCAGGAATARYVAVTIRAEYVPYFNYGGLLKGGGTKGGFITQGDAVVRIQ